MVTLRDDQFIEMQPEPQLVLPSKFPVVGYSGLAVGEPAPSPSAKKDPVFKSSKHKHNAIRRSVNQEKKNQKLKQEKAKKKREEQVKKANAMGASLDPQENQITAKNEQYRVCNACSSLGEEMMFRREQLEDHILSHSHQNNLKRKSL